METPPRKVDAQNATQSRRKYTDEEKKQLLANLDLEGMSFTGLFIITSRASSEGSHPAV